MNNDGEDVPLPSTTFNSADMVMDDVTPQNNQLEYFKEQLREIDCAINAGDFLMETSSSQVPVRGILLS